MSVSLTRRTFVIAAPLLLGGCVSAGTSQTAPKGPKGKRQIPQFYRDMYAAVSDEQFPIPAPDLTKIEPKYYRQEVAYNGPEIPGSVVVDTPNRFLYLLLGDGRAMRYGIGVGKAGLEFEGTGVIQYKREWPRWTPTPDMIAREPERYGPLRQGMEPGPTNPLGSRALYLFKNGVDTLYRIHGTNEDWSIGRSISSGCIRMLNQDVIDLYRRVRNGSRVIVLQQNMAPAA